MNSRKKYTDLIIFVRSLNQNEIAENLQRKKPSEVIELNLCNC